MEAARQDGASACATEALAVEFYFELASPYAYLSSERIEAVCAGLGVPLVWKPFMLGPILRRTGARPLFLDGLRGAYARQDCLRWARLHGIPFRYWAAEPTNSLKAARGALVLQGRASHVPFIHACFRAHFVEGRNLDDDGLMAELVSGLGEDAAAFRSAIAAPELKRRLIDETEAAFARGVFGAPTFFFGDEMFWGNDRLTMLEAVVLASGRGGPARG